MRITPTSIKFEIEVIYWIYSIYCTWELSVNYTMLI